MTWFLLLRTDLNQAKRHLSRFNSIPKEHFVLFLKVFKGMGAAFPESWHKSSIANVKIANLKNVWASYPGQPLIFGFNAKANLFKRLLEQSALK